MTVNCGFCKRDIHLIDPLIPPYTFWEENLYLAGEELICRDCLAEISFRDGPACPLCDHSLDSAGIPCPNCRDLEIPFLETLAVGDYRGLLKDLVYNFKFQKNRRLASPLGKLLALKIMGRVEDKIRKKGLLAVLKYLGVGDKSYDLVTPVPLHRDRLLERGFNQSELLARVVSRETGIQYRDLVVRTRPTPPQKGLTRVEREHNLQGAFEFISLGKKDMADGQRILLVDDVLTTGITAGEITRILLEHGAVEVTVLVLCR